MIKEKKTTRKNKFLENMENIKKDRKLIVFKEATALEINHSKFYIKSVKSRRNTKLWMFQL